VTRVSHALDRIDATFDYPNLVADAWLLLVATLSQRLGLEELIDATVRLDGRVGGAPPGPQGAHVGARDVRERVAHRSRGQASRRSDRGGVGSSGDGPVDDRNVPQIVHVRALPADGSRQRSRPATCVGGGCRTGHGAIGDRHRFHDLRS